MGIHLISAETISNKRKHFIDPYSRSLDLRQTDATERHKKVQNTLYKFSYYIFTEIYKNLDIHV